MNPLSTRLKGELRNAWNRPFSRVPRVSRFGIKAGALALVVTLVCAVAVEARVRRIVIKQRQSPAFEGKTFGNAGQYEILSGLALGELDPKDPHNALITDLLLAPRNDRGMVAYVTTFTLMKPVDASRSNGVLIYAVPNRGNRI